MGEHAADLLILIPERQSHKLNLVYCDLQFIPLVLMAIPIHMARLSMNGVLLAY